MNVFKKMHVVAFQTQNNNFNQQSKESFNIREQQRTEAFKDQQMFDLFSFFFLLHKKRLK